MTDPKYKPWTVEFRSSETFISVVIAIAVFTDVFLFGMIVPIVPFALVSRGGVSEKDSQKWVSILLCAFGAANVIGSPIVGRIGDFTNSRKAPFVVGLVVLLASTVLFWVAASPIVLVIARMMQGFSASIVWILGLAVIVDTVDPSRLGVAMSYITIANMSGAMLGPLIGGVVFHEAGYHAVFIMAIGLIVVDVILRFAMIEKKTAKHMKEDGERQSLLAQPTDSNGYGTSNGGNELTNSKAKTKPDSAFFTLLRSKRLLVSMLAFIIGQTLLTSFDSILPIFVIRTFKFSSLGSGLMFLPITVPAFAAPLIGRAVDKYGPKWPCFLGFFLAFPPLVLMRVVTQTATRDIVILSILLFIFGLCHSAQEISLQIEVSRTLDEMDKASHGSFDKGAVVAQAYGLVGMSVGIGMFIGPLMAGFIMDRADWSAATLVLGILSGVTAIPLLFFTGGRLSFSSSKNKLRIRDDDAELPNGH